MPKELRDGFRMQRYGAPYSGGWMHWPVKWLLPVETALNVYDTLTAVNTAMSRLSGEQLASWQAENSRIVKSALEITRLRDELENGD